MGSLSLNEIRDRALDFQNEWKDGKSESSDKQTFYNEFFNVFGITRKRVASFEEPIKKLGNKQGFIDLFWKGVLLVEHKSFGKSLIKAKEQAFEYFPNIKEHELPKYILVSDFNNFELYDLEENKEYHFKLEELSKNIEILSFMAGYTKRVYEDQEPVSIEASNLMGKLYEKLDESHYKEHDLELFLVRILFCLFSDDTGIFKKDDFKYLLIENTKEDGSDTGALLSQLFEVLNTPENSRQTTLDEALSNFPYVNGLLFDSAVRIPSFNSDMRQALLDCCFFNWSDISPAIFGSLFQCVADEDKRRKLGEHYTTEKNIMKVISPLFLDELKKEFASIKNNISKLKEFQIKLSKLKFFDPACGCGNFLILSYKEIRKLEIEALKIIHKEDIKNHVMVLDVSTLSIIDVDNFYGIEISEFPSKIAEVAMWLMDHQMNMLLSKEFGRYIERIPLEKSATIKNINALTTDWTSVISKTEASYILGNPPFIGARMKSAEQSQEMNSIFTGLKGAMDLDYVCAWYKKASEFIQGTKIKVGFVSTNSITQGTQVGVLWNYLMNKYNIKIHFAHKTFEWDSEASGKAHVHCVIIGFACFDISVKRLFDYDDIKGEAHEIIVENINPYLIDFKNLVVQKQSKPICYNVPQIVLGNMANDNGNFLFTKEEKDEFLENEPNASKFIKRFIGSEEYINNKERYCLWLKDVSPSELKSMPLVLDRIKKVKEYRLKSKREATKKLALTPYLFGEIRQPNTNYIVIPRVSSERRKYIPIGFLDKDIISSDRCSIVYSDSLYTLGVLMSIMHMTWTKYVCGRLKSDYTYSGNIVYNNYPWAKNVSKTQIDNIETKAKHVLDVRAKYPSSSLADLYDPNTMPADLVKAHAELDKAVDSSYTKTTFKNETERIGFLFELYEEYTSPLISGSN